ncbi:hypothetical protein [Umezawaea sp. NPDC059074]|uniref:hypothetical protein n=1 Tax=Umezawaea sp. NPDC059074 TaxID=3346716 RepID=UPI0036B90123
MELLHRTTQRARRTDSRILRATTGPARGRRAEEGLLVGFAAGIVTKELFSVLVVVALVTTVMATPMLTWWDRRDRARHHAGAERSLSTATRGHPRLHR